MGRTIHQAADTAGGVGTAGSAGRRAGSAGTGVGVSGVVMRCGLAAFGVGLVVAGSRGVAANWVSLPVGVVVACGVVLLVLGITPVAVAGGGTGCGCDTGHGTDHAARHGAGGPRWRGSGHVGLDGLAGAVVAVAALVICLVAPGPLSVRQVPDANPSVAGLGSTRDWPGVPDGSVLSLREFVARSADPTGPRPSGVRVVLVGDLDTTDDGTVFLRRVVVTCCAADARRYSVRLVDPSGVLVGVDQSVRQQVTVGFVSGSAGPESGWVPTAVVVASAPEPGGVAYERQSP